MSDLISRQSAIDAIYDAFSYAYCDNCEKHMDEDLCGDCHRKYQNWAASRNVIENTINSLPSAEPQWTPCSEGLPEEHTDVLVIFRYDRNMAVGHWEKVGANGVDEAIWYANTGDGWYLSEREPVAWRDLPEQYEDTQDA